MKQFNKITIALIHFLFLIVGNLLCLKFCFHQSSLRYIALIGFLIIGIEIFIVPFQISKLFINKNYSIFEIESKKHKKDKEITKAERIMAILLILLVIIQIYGFIHFNKYQVNELEVKGIETEAIVFNKKWESRGKGSWSDGNYIYYFFKYQGKTYRHSQLNESINTNDTIIIKFLPKNPNNHVVLKKKQ